MHDRYDSDDHRYALDDLGHANLVEIQAAMEEYFQHVVETIRQRLSVDEGLYVNSRHGCHEEYVN